MNEYKKGTPVVIVSTGQEGVVIASVGDISKYLIQLDSGIAVLKYANEITVKE